MAAARRLFETIGVWDKVEAQPILDMVITDSRLQDAVRPTFLTFDGDVEPGEPFAHMVENAPLLVALTAKAKEEGVVLRASAVGGLSPISAASAKADARSSHACVSSRTATRSPRGFWSPPTARIRSIRERAGIASHGWSYAQSTIVTTVAHERDHHGRAEEHFLPAGPFAILPLKRGGPPLVDRLDRGGAGGRAHRRAARRPDFHAELERRFGLHLGEIEAVGPRRALSARALRSRARSSPIASRWSATPRM